MFANKKEFFEFIESKCKTNYDYRVLRNSLKNIDVEDIQGNIIEKIESFIKMNEEMIYTANFKMNELYKEIDLNEKAFSEYRKIDSFRKNFLNENQLLEQIISFLKIKKEDNEFDKYINIGNQDIITDIYGETKFCYLIDSVDEKIYDISLKNGLKEIYKNCVIEYKKRKKLYNNGLARIIENEFKIIKKTDKGMKQKLLVDIFFKRISEIDTGDVFIKVSSKQVLTSIGKGY